MHTYFICKGANKISLVYSFYRQLKQMISSMGANPIEDLAKYDKVTHFIVGNSEEAMSRTMKLMMAISYGVPVVKFHWLVDSSKAGKLLPCDEYFPDDKGL